MLEEIEAHRRNGVAWKSERSGAMAEEARRLREPHYAALKEKYQRAAYRPWETPAPDPPDPGEKLVQEAWTTQMTESLTVEPFEARLDQFDVPMPQKLEPIPTGKPTPAKGRPTGRAKSES